MRQRWAVCLLFAACAFPVDVGGVVGCSRDDDCGASKWCVDTVCVACPDVSGCVAPLNQQALRRNGCATCDFAPAGQCEGDAWCNGLSCSRGARCATGCTGFGCCANVCATPGCADAAPLGCNLACSADLGCTTCIAGKCRCDASGWQCVPTCTDPGFDAGCAAAPVP